MTSNNIVTLVDLYFSVEEEIKILTKKIAELKPKKLMYSEQISDFISKSDKDYFQVGEKTIKLVKQKKKVFKRKNIEDSIKERVKDDTIQKAIFQDSIEEQDADVLKISKK